MCGERQCNCHSKSCSCGSSPRVRGTPFDTLDELREFRFIPACAGNAAWRAARSRADAGSSPRVRGTPAHRPPAAPRCPVHPRVCGERVCGAPEWQRCCGSSPRVRGTPGACSHGYRDWRFIPACAGNARPSARGAAPSSVHPRVCGERQYTIHGIVAQDGSSPRVRGTQICRGRFSLQE